MDFTQNNISNIQFKEQDVTSLYLDNNLIWENIVNNIVEDILWQPALNGETGANYRYSYSETNGEGIGKGFVLYNHEFSNTDYWQLSFEFQHDDIRYTGIIYLCDKDTFVTPDMGHVNNADVLYSWEGTWPGGERYAYALSGKIDYFDVVVTKIRPTTVNLYSRTLNRNTTVNVPWLVDAETLTCGAIHNNAFSDFGPCRIKNVKAVNIGDPIVAETRDVNLQSPTEFNKLIGKNIVIDWDDGNISTNNFSHTYTTNRNNHIKLYNVQGLKKHAFDSQITKSTFIRIDIPRQINFIDDYCFTNQGNSLMLYLYWTQSGEIIPYNNTWGATYFLVPYNTLREYYAAGYLEAGEGNIIERNFEGNIIITLSKNTVYVNDVFRMKIELENCRSKAPFDVSIYYRMAGEQNLHFVKQDIVGSVYAPEYIYLEFSEGEQTGERIYIAKISTIGSNEAHIIFADTEN